MVNLQTERLFRALIEKSRDAILLVAADGQIFYANPSAEAMLGCTPNTMLTLTVHDLIHDGDIGVLAKIFAQAANASDIRVELRLHHLNGSWLWFECIAANLLNDPAVEGILLNLRDITDRKETRQTLQPQRDLLFNLTAVSQATSEATEHRKLLQETKAHLADHKALVENSLDGFVLINQLGQTRVINSAAIKLLGLANVPTNWVNQSVVGLLFKARHTCPELVETMIEEFKRTRSGDDAAATGEVQMMTKRVMWIHMPLTVNDRILGRLIVLRDITEQRKLEQQREELTDMIVHDLRNPASAVSGIVSMLKTLKAQNEIPEDFDQMMQLAERNVTKLLDLIQEILDVSKLESGQLPVNKAAFPLDQIIDETLQLQRPIITMKEMVLDFDIQPDMPLVWGDERLIRRVLQNLVDNAAKFSRRNSKIFVSAKVSAENSNWVQVSVQDFGVGIPTELQTRVFEKFVTNRQNERGSGIGLTFCRLAVLAHGGRIWAESEENRGSTFHFTLPIATT